MPTLKLPSIARSHLRQTDGFLVQVYLGRYGENDATIGLVRLA